MSKYRYLIIGGGMTAYAAIKGIRATDSNAKDLVSARGSEGDPAFGMSSTNTQCSR